MVSITIYIHHLIQTEHFYGAGYGINVPVYTYRFESLVKNGKNYHWYSSFDSSNILMVRDME